MAFEQSITINSANYVVTVTTHDITAVGEGRFYQLLNYDSKDGRDERLKLGLRGKEGMEAKATTTTDTLLLTVCHRAFPKPDVHALKLVEEEIGAMAMLDKRVAALELETGRTQTLWINEDMLGPCITSHANAKMDVKYVRGVLENDSEHDHIALTVKGEVTEIVPRLAPGCRRSDGKSRQDVLAELQDAADKKAQEIAISDLPLLEMIYPIQHFYKIKRLFSEEEPIPSSLQIVRKWVKSGTVKPHPYIYDVYTRTAPLDVVGSITLRVKKATSETPATTILDIMLRVGPHKRSDTFTADSVAPDAEFMKHGWICQANVPDGLYMDSICTQIIVRDKRLFYNPSFDGKNKVPTDTMINGSFVKTD